MPITPNRSAFGFNHKDQVDEFGIATGDYQEVQRLFDTRAEENLADINNIKNTLASTVDGDSGADNVKITQIANVTGLNVQEALEYLATNVSSALTDKADKTNVIEKDSTVPYTPTTQYHPTNKGYVDDQIAQAVIGSIFLIKATEQEAIEGTNDVKYMTPLKVKQAIENVIKYQDVINLSATTAGVITWSLPQATDQTRTAIILCRATKDISNFDYATCLSDSDVTKNTLGKDAVTNTYTGLTNNTQYWVKCFVEYTIGGKQYYSNGVTVTFTTPAITITEFYNAGNEFTAVTGGWKNGLMGGSGSVAKNPTNITINAPSNSDATVMTTNLINFTPIKTLKFEIEFAKTSSGSPTNGSASLGISVQTNGIDQTNRIILYDNKTRQIFSTDVSAVNSNKYISIYLNATFDATANLILHRVWGED